MVENGPPRRSGGRRERQRIRAANPEGSTPPIRPGMSGGQFNPLSNADVLKINDAAMEVLETIGIGEVPDLVMTQALARGARKNDQGRLLFPRPLIEDIIATAGRNFVLHGRVPKYDLELNGTNVHFGTGGAAVQVLDPDQHSYRASTLVDLYDFARLVDLLENVHWFTRCVVATDVTNEFDLDVNTAFACLAGTEKHIGTSFVHGHHVRPIVEMFDAVLGEEGGFRKRPFCKVHISPVISPLRYGEDAVGVMLAAIEEGMPINCIIAAQSGATAPAPLAGMLIQTVAETLAGLILVNLFAPGYPVVFSNWPFVVDLRTGAFACGGAEIALLNAASAQMSNFYDLPSGVAAGMADSKLPDAQAGYEKAVSAVTAGLSGANMIYEAAGMYASLLGCSFEGFVLDNEILGTALRVVRGIEVNSETTDLDVIRDVVAGAGHFLGENQTLAAMQRDYYYPSLADRTSPEVWDSSGGFDALARCRFRSRELLAGHYPNYIPRKVEQRIRAKYNILLPEDTMKSGERW